MSQEVIHGHGRGRGLGRRRGSERVGWRGLHHGVAHFGAKVFKELMSLGNGNIAGMGVMEIANALKTGKGCHQEDLEGGKRPGCLKDFGNDSRHVHGRIVRRVVRVDRE